MKFARLYFLFLITLFPPMLFAAPKTFLVNTTADTEGKASNCMNAVDACTLRDAVSASNTNSGVDVITLEGKTYPLSLGHLNLLDSVTIQGVSKQATVITNVAGKKNRILNIRDVKQATLKNLTIKGGVLESTAFFVQTGAGIRAENVGLLTLEGMNLHNNKISSPLILKTDLVQASALYLKNGGLHVENSQIAFNQASTVNFCNGESCCGADDICAAMNIVHIDNDQSTADVSFNRSFYESNSVNGLLHEWKPWVMSGDFLAYRSNFRHAGVNVISGAFYDEERVVALTESGFEGDVGSVSFDMNPDPVFHITGNTFNGVALKLDFRRSPEWPPAGGQRPSTIVNNTFFIKDFFGLNLGHIANLWLVGTLEEGQDAKVLFRPFDILHNTMQGPISINGTLTLSNVNAFLQNNILYNMYDDNFARLCHLTGGSLQSGGGNILHLDFGQETGCPLHAADVLEDPLLEPLGWNGGFTATMALSESSPAINAALPLDTISRDQRSFKRPQGGAPDSGAFESAFEEEEN